MLPLGIWVPVNDSSYLLSSYKAYIEFSQFNAFFLNFIISSKCFKDLINYAFLSTGTLFRFTSEFLTPGLTTHSREYSVLIYHR